MLKNITEQLTYPLRKMLFHALVPEIKTEIVDGKIKAWTDSPLKKVYQPMLDYFCDRLNNQKVVGKHNGSNVYTLFNPPQPSPSGMRIMMARIADQYFNIKTPTTATISLTYDCQLDCVHCSRVDKIDGRKKTLSTKEMKKVIDDSLDLGVVNITFTGGDPFVRKDIYELIAHVDKKKANVILFTHGQTLNEASAKKLKEAGLYGLLVSLDHSKPEVHDQLRKLPGAFERAVKGALAVKSEGMLIGVSTYATREKLEDGSLEELLYFAEEKGFNEVVIFDPIPSGKFRDKLEEIVLTPLEREGVRKLSKKFLDRDNKMGVIAQSFVNSPFGNGCFGGYYQFYLTPYGDVNPCDFNPISLGNIRKDGGIKGVWEKMVKNPEYMERKLKCRMQDKVYRARFLEHLPENAQFPIPIEIASAKMPLPDEFITDDGKSSIDRGNIMRGDDSEIFQKLVVKKTG